MLDPVAWKRRERTYSNAQVREWRVCPVMTSKKNTTASRASGNVREHAAARVGSGRLRENAVPRHVLNVDYRAFAKHVPNVFRSLWCFLDEFRLSTLRCGLDKMLTTPRP